MAVAERRQLAADLRRHHGIEHFGRRQLDVDLVRPRPSPGTSNAVLLALQRLAAFRARTSSCAAGRRPSARSPASPTMPRDRTNAFLCGHMFCVAYHSPRLAKLNTAICDLPYLTVAPPSMREVVRVADRRPSAAPARPAARVRPASGRRACETAPATRTRSASRPAGSARAR